jgi:uncharacterized membrane protein YhfC
MDILFLTHLLNALLMIGMPIGLAIFLARRWRLGWRLWFIGGAVFILSQVGHIPFNALATLALNRTPLAAWPHSSLVVFNAVFLGLSAGLFEEFSRYAMYRWWAKDARSWRRGVLAGAGHGGAEAVLLGLLTLASFIQLVALRGADLSTIVPADQLAVAQQQMATFWSMPWYDSLLGALERMFTIPIQIAFSVLVLQTFVRRQAFWVWLAVLFHAIVDATAVLCLPTVGMYWTEAIVAGFSILSLALIFALRRPESTLELPPASPNAKPPSTILPVTETADNLDSTRFA